MEIRGSIQQILVKGGKDHDIRFELHLEEEDVVQFFRWRGQTLAITLDPVHLQMELPNVDAKDPAADGARFWIDEGSFPILADEESGEYRLTGKELRELVDPPAEQLWQWVQDPFNAGQHKREAVEDSALISLVDGDRFTALELESLNGQVEHADDAGEERDLNAPTPMGAVRGRGAE